jgi:DNA-binding MarR family transcriptional regulator
MAKALDIRQLASQRLHELFPRAAAWEEIEEYPVGSQRADLLVRFKMGPVDSALVLEFTSVGQPRQIRESIARLGEIRRDLPTAYPVAVAEYVSPQSAALLRRAGMGYLDLSGNCYLSFEHVQIEKEGQPNLRPSTRPLRSLFAPRASRVARVLLVDPQHAWRLEELAKAADVSLGHAHNVVKRMEELSWIERGEHQRIRLAKAGELLEAWRDAYTFRQNRAESCFTTERLTRKLVAELARICHAEGRRYAFTLHAGAALIAPSVRFPAIHCYVEGDPAPIMAGLGLRPAEGEGNVNLLEPYDDGVFYAPVTKGGLPVVCLPQLYVDLYRYERRGREQAAHLRREAMGY